jgi:hypothetical protein
MILFKRKKVVIDAFTRSVGVYEFAKPDFSRNFFPDWWKSMRSKYPIHNVESGVETYESTLKRCDGLLDLHKNTISIPLWSDLQITTNSEGRYTWQYATPVGTGMHTHPSQQMDGVFDDYTHVKIETPWLFFEKTGVNFYFTEPVWSMKDKWQDLVIPPAVINFKYQDTTNVNCFFRKKDATHQFKFGEPIATIVPMTEHEVDIRHHLVDEKEYRRLHEAHLYAPKWNGSYKLRKRLWQEKEQNQKKCPITGLFK